MSNGEHQFFMDSGFFSQKMKDIVEEISKEISSLSLYNYEEGGYKRSWLTIENQGEPFNSSTASDVIARIEDELDEDEIYESSDESDSSKDDECDECDECDEDDEDKDYVEDDDDPYSGWKW